PRPTRQNLRYLQTKVERMGHLIELPPAPDGGTDSATTGGEGMGASYGGGLDGGGRRLAPAAGGGGARGAGCGGARGGGGRRFALAASRFNRLVTDLLVTGAREELRR